MGYEKKKIIDVIKDIEGNKLYLPALQRKFVWGKHQIQLLFDSLMRNYPIGTFLFWKLKSQKANSYVFYEFLKEYDERNPFNRRYTGKFLHPEIIGVLDGQQRLSSMYIGLQGTHTERARYKWASNERAYPKTRLYLNVLSLPYSVNDENKITINEEHNFEFRFLTEQDSKNLIKRNIRDVDADGLEVEREEFLYWLLVGDVIAWDEEPEFDIIIDGFISACSNEGQTQQIESKRRLIKRCLETLHKRIYDDSVINYFEVNKEDLEDILKIFTRVNSGGTQLNKTDLLFSTIVATWDNGRDEIESLLKSINNKGAKFNFTNEYLMRACLVLTDAPVVYKVHSFEAENVERIKSQWTHIAAAINKTVDLLDEFGFSGQVLTSQNATLIIAYHIYKGGDLSDSSKRELQKYLIHVLLNGVFGSAQDQVISNLRNALRVEVMAEPGLKSYKLKLKAFSFDSLLSAKLPARKSLYVTDQEIESFLTYRKGPLSFFVLSLLYPHLRFNEIQFQQDHMHPASKFTDRIFDNLNIPVDQRQEWLVRRDMVPNLQLLEVRQNASKQATFLKDWVAEMSTTEQGLFRLTNYIPEGTSLEFADFLSFFEGRKEVLRAKMKEVLKVNNQIMVPEEVEEPTDDDFEDSAIIALEETQVEHYE